MRKQLSIAIIFCLALVALAGCGGAKIKLLAEDADLFWAEDVILEPDKAPFNLGGWRSENIVAWTVEIPKEGSYDIELEYSRPGGYEPAPGLVRIFADDDEYELNFTADTTGKEGGEDDWSVYKTKVIGGANLSAGTVVLEISPNYSDDSEFDYFINLRTVTLISS
jgi:hypothetical protein